MTDWLISHYAYWSAATLMATGLYIVIAAGHLVKKLIGLNIFQTSIFMLYIAAGDVQGATAPILHDDFKVYANPLPHVLILTAIVVGLASTAVGLALAARVREAFGTVEEDELDARLNAIARERGETSE